VYACSYAFITFTQSCYGCNYLDYVKGCSPLFVLVYHVRPSGLAQHVFLPDTHTHKHNTIIGLIHDVITYKILWFISMQ